jgi:LPXTG-motif cell wall-anchored protein
MFELSVKNGGEITLISNQDETAAFQAAQATEAELVAGAQQRNRLFGIGGLVILLLALGALFFLKRELLAKA